MLHLSQRLCGGMLIHLSAKAGEGYKNDQLFTIQCSARKPWAHKLIHVDFTLQIIIRLKNEYQINLLMTLIIHDGSNRNHQQGNVLIK